MQAAVVLGPVSSSARRPLPLASAQPVAHSPPASRAPRSPARAQAASRLHRILKTVFAMLRKRGYVVRDEDLRMRPEQFAANYGSDVVNRKMMTLQLFKQTNQEDKIYVFFPEGDISIGDIKKECVGRARARRRLVLHPRAPPAAPPPRPPLTSSPPPRAA